MSIHCMLNSSGIIISNQKGFWTDQISCSISNLYAEFQEISLIVTKVSHHIENIVYSFGIQLQKMVINF